MIKRDLYYDRIPTKSLREDVRYLGFVLGKVIKDQEGEKFFNLVEKIRKLSKRLAIITAIITIFKPTMASSTAPVYALAQGLFLGGITVMFDAQYPCIAIQAIGLTFGTLASLLVFYKTTVMHEYY